MANIREDIIVVVMGPCGCGKSEAGQKLAEAYECPFLDADTFHSDANIVKMKNDTPLTDQDRIPWLVRVRQELMQFSSANGTETRISAVVGCSALKLMYRNILRYGIDHQSPLEQEAGRPRVIFALVDCSKEVLQQRLTKRSGHFMKSSMLESQLTTLERPEGDELKNAVVVNGDLSLQLVVNQMKEKIDVLISM